MIRKFPISSTYDHSELKFPENFSDVLNFQIDEYLRSVPCLSIFVSAVMQRGQSGEEQNHTAGVGLLLP